MAARAAGAAAVPASPPSASPLLWSAPTFAPWSGRRGLDVATDRAGNLWAWWGDPAAAAAAGDPGIVTGSHLDSVPGGGAYDGPLGVASAFAALDVVRAAGHRLARPVGVACFGDEEGARFGIACAGSRLLTGVLAPGKALGLHDADGVSMGEAMSSARHPVRYDGREALRDDESLRRVGAFVELHIEQGRGLVHLDRPVAVGTSIWPHGRWRLELRGEANHAGTTPLADRRDPMLGLAAAILEARSAAQGLGCVATIGKVVVQPGGVNAIPSRVIAWLDARGPVHAAVRSVVEAVGAAAQTRAVPESFSAATVFDADLADRLAATLDGAPRVATAAGHDAGVLAAAGIPTAMLFVRNPTGVSHAPDELAELGDCLDGVDALARVLLDLTR